MEHMRGVGLFFIFCTGCAGSLDVTRTVSPSEADPKLEARAIVRGAERIELPQGAHVEGTRAVLAAGTVATIALDPGDVVVRDEGGRIASVRSGDVVTVRFAPETAEMIDASSVRGEIADMPLRAGDAVEVHGTFAPGDALPGGGRVESSRMTGALVGGITLFAIAYGPSAYAGSQSSNDRALLVPFVGPWLDLANRPQCVAPSQIALAAASAGIDPCIGDTAVRVALVASGVAQGLGALLTIVGLPSHSEIHGGDHGVRVSLVPTGLGAAAVGTF